MGHLKCVAIALIVVAAGNVERAHAGDSTEEAPVESSAPAQDRWFDHSVQSRWWVSAQINVISQLHPAFAAAYSGDNSLRPEFEAASTRVASLFAGVEATPRMEVWAVAESAGGHGLSRSLGAVGAPNADAVRNPELGPTPYMARLFFRYVMPLSSETLPIERGPLNLHDQVPARRVAIVVGKFALPDFFDVNSVGSDDHLQFMNLTAVSSAAWQYAGDARGYTDGVMVEYVDRSWALRFAEALEPRVPNATQLDWHIASAHSETLEFETQAPTLAGHPGTVRILAFDDHATGGDYARAVELFLQGRTVLPLIESTRAVGRRKYGASANIEQPITDNLRSFARVAWSDARFESYEVNQSAALGGDYLGQRWHRSGDKVGFVLLGNAIDRNVQSYLQHGGDGILLGDGSLRYGREIIEECYYNAQLARGFTAALDIQHIQNPGYNRDRGPVWVLGLRLHLEF